MFKKIIFTLLCILSFLHSYDTTITIPINNDEHLYKKKIMEDEILKKDFNSIIGLKNFLVYNQFGGKSLFLNIKFSVNNVDTTQQFIIKQNDSGTPSIYEISTPYLFKLNELISNTIGDDEVKKEELYLPTGPEHSYHTIDSFLAYTYLYTLHFTIRQYDLRDVAQGGTAKKILIKKVYTDNFYINTNNDGGIKIDTIDTTNTYSTSSENNLLFSFSRGFEMSKRKDLKEFVRPNDLTTNTKYINNTKMNLNKNLNTHITNSFLSLIQDDNDPDNELIYKSKNSDVKIKEFYIIKADIEILK